jgi:hypothetical protein
MSLRYMGVPDRCHHGNYEDRCQLCERDKKIASLEAEIERLRAAILAMRRLWPAERWATLSAICRDHPCIDEIRE